MNVAQPVVDQGCYNGHIARTAIPGSVRRVVKSVVLLSFWGEGDSSTKEQVCIKPLGKRR
jgi:hypothetical protein